MHKKLILPVSFFALMWSRPLVAQTITDGVMMPKQDLCTGFVYEHDRWSSYWEGTLKRDNQNIGTLTTRSVTWMGSYGLTDDINVIAMVPYVSTSASLGVLKGIHGVQDLSLAVKYRGPRARVGRGSLRAFAVASVAGPLTDYTPDFYPLSIGSHSRRLAGRLTLSYTEKRGLYVDASGAYTWRDDVTLDRSSYYTDGHLYYSDQVDMPGVVDYTIRAGYNGRRIKAPVSYSWQHTLGGGDIRRQDMPFVSNRMNASRLEATLSYSVPRLENLAVKLGAARTLTGRNVGQSTTFQTGILYTFHFGGPRS
jgi:hypothetical protein